MKNYRGLLILISLVVLCSMNAGAQELSVGDQLPDYTFAHVLRYSSPTASLSDFRGKVLILDFWRTTCGGCIKAMPHLDSLQNEFGDKLTVMPLTTEGEDTIQRFLATNYIAKRIHLPTITEDTLLAGKAIKFIYIPHTVLVDTSGTIVAITEPKYVTRDVIQNLLDGKPVYLPRKMEILDFNYSTPVFWEGKERNAKYVRYASTITSMIPGVIAFQGIDSLDKQIFYYGYNRTIQQLYAQAYKLDYNPNRVVLEVADSSNFIPPADANELEWKAKHLWVYNLLLPSDGTAPAPYAVQDIDRFFRTTGKIATRRMNCLVLVKAGKKDTWKSKGGQPEFETRDSITTIRNVRMYNIAYAFDFMSSLPVVNETGLVEEKADITLTRFPNDLAAFRKDLVKHGLDLVPAQRDIKVLVIADTQER